jgi:hypothetical protein
MESAMTAPATALLGLELVKVQELHYGKLIAAQGGHVLMGEDYAATYQTKGVLHPDRILPARLLDGVLLRPNHIEEPFRRAGAIFMRLVDETLVAMRLRFRPEAGEGRPGRNYLQASIFQIEAPRGFASVPPGIIPWVAEQKVAPDLTTTPAAERIGVEPQLEYVDAPINVTPSCLDAFGPKRRVRISAIIQAMRQAGPAVVGNDSFDDPIQGPELFLNDVKFALTLMVQGEIRVSSYFQVACGLSPEIAKRSLVLSSVEQSTPQSAVKWDDVVRIVSPPARSARTPAAQSTFGQRATVATLQSREAPGRPPTAISKPQSATRQIPSSNTTSTRTQFLGGTLETRGKDQRLASATTITAREMMEFVSKADSRGDNASPGHHAAARSSTPGPQAETLDAFSAIFQNARDSRSRAACLELFRFAADRYTHQALKSWTPFDVADPTQKDVLLALLMGLSGRGDLLDSFAFTELCCVWSYLELIDVSDNPDYLHRLIKCMDHRISDLGMLIRNELKLVGSCHDRYGAEPFSSDMPRRLAEDTEYYRCIDLLNSSDLADHDLETSQTIESGLKRVYDRFNKTLNKGADNLVFCTSKIEPSQDSIFQLPRRQEVAQESYRVFTTELTTAQGLLRLGGAGGRSLRKES